MVNPFQGIILVTIDFHGYVRSYERALVALGYEVRTFVGLRSYHWPTRLRNLATITVPNAVGGRRDRAEIERSRLADFLAKQELSGMLVLFVNSQQLVTDAILQHISDRGGTSVIWLLDGMNVHATSDLSWGRFDLVASFNKSD